MLRNSSNQSTETENLFCIVGNAPSSSETMVEIQTDLAVVQSTRGLLFRFSRTVRVYENVFVAPKRVDRGDVK
jgi:hypothetical protein